MNKQSISEQSSSYHQNWSTVTYQGSFKSCDTFVSSDDQYYQLDTTKKATSYRIRMLKFKLKISDTKLTILQYTLGALITGQLTLALSYSSVLVLELICLESVILLIIMLGIVVSDLIGKAFYIWHRNSMGKLCEKILIVSCMWATIDKVGGGDGKIKILLICIQ